MLKRVLICVSKIVMACGIVVQATGCNYLASPTIIEVLTEEKKVDTFYGEGIGRLYIDNKLVQDIAFKEWKGLGKNYCVHATYKTEKTFFEEYYEEEITPDMLDGDIVTISEQDVFNDSELIIYLPYKNQYCIKSMSLVDEVTGELRNGVINDLKNGSLRDYVMETVNELEENYELSIEDDQKVNGYLTQHIIAVPKNKSMNEQYELWIDQSTWMIVKEKQISGNYTYESEYTKFQLNAKVDENLFKMTIPKDAEIEYLDNNLEKTNEKVTLDEAVVKLGAPIFYLEEGEADLIEAHYIESVDSRYGRVELTYHTHEGNEFMVRSSPSSILYEKLNLGYEKVKIGNVEGNYVDVGSVKYVEFIVEGSICDVYSKNSNLGKEALIELARKVKIKNK